MFTGIITEIGSIATLERVGPSSRIGLRCEYPKLELGESIAVNGVCLTVVKIVGHGFEADASAETLERTTLGSARVGTKVNLERALAVGDRLGGHIVAGHVDCVGRVSARENVGEAQRWTFEAPEEIRGFLAEKGSIAIDGVSLTVNRVGPTTFEVMLVPFTLKATALGEKDVGNFVNLEADVIARYVSRALQTRTASSEGLTLSLLERAGFTGR